jgi:NADH-quinone oxidoreductase subunit M
MVLGPSQIAGLALLALAGFVAVYFFEGAGPVVAAAIVAALVPRRYGWNVRLPLAATAGLLVLFVVGHWSLPASVTAEGGRVQETPHLLSWIVWLPLVGAIGVLFIPRQSHTTLRWTTLLVMAATLCVSLALLRVPMGRTFHFNEDVPWMPRFGIHYHLAVDGISLWLVILTAFITPIAAYASFGPVTTRIKDWCFALLLLEGGMLGAFVALDLFLFYVFWELMLVPMYVMIGVWGGTNRIRSAIKFFLYTMFGSVLMLGAILYMAYAYAKVTGGTPSFDYFELQRVMLPRHLQIWLWAAFTLAFVIKVPMWPVHTWLPDAHTEAPTAGSIILAAVMLKAGTYGYLRYSMGLFPEASAEWAPNLAGVAVLFGIIYGALCAWKQDDVKRLIAYSSVAHLGYVMLGLFALTTASIEGAVLQMVNHGISTGLLFLLFGVIYDRRHTRNIEAFGGLAKPMPVYATLFVIATLASVGLPGTNGFVGEFMVITGAAVSAKLGSFGGVQAMGAAIGVILGAVYMLMVVQKVFFGPVTKKENEHLQDVTPREILAAAPLVIMIFVIGLFPNVFLSQIRDAAERVQSDFDSRFEKNPPPRYYEGPITLTSRRPDAPSPVMPAPSGRAGSAAGAP